LPQIATLDYLTLTVVADKADWFLNGWHNVGSAYATAAYFVDSSGVVHLKGMIGGGTVSDSGTGTAFQIGCLGPDDRLPHRFAVDSNHAFGEVTVTTVPNSTCGGIDSVPIGPDAQVEVTGGSNAAVALDGITWRAVYLFTKAP